MIDGPQIHLDQGTAVIDLGDDAIGIPEFVEPHGFARPFDRRHDPAFVGDNVALTVLGNTSYNEPALVGTLSVADGWIDRHDDPVERRCERAAGALHKVSRKDRALDVVEQLGVKLLPAEAGALVSGDNVLKECRSGDSSRWLASNCG